MPRPLPDNPALIVTDPDPLERFAGFPHAIVALPLDDLLSYGGFDLLEPATTAPRAGNLLTPGEPEAAL